jgi:outer membrane protein assembly factor BamB
MSRLLRIVSLLAVQLLALLGAEARAVKAPAVLWEDRFALPAVDAARPISIQIRGGRVYLATSSPRLEGWEVRAYDARSGGLVWATQPEAFGQADAVSALATGAGRVLAVGPKALRGLAAATGRSAWRRPLPGTAEPYNDVRAAALGRMLFVAGLKRDPRGELHYRVWAHQAGSGELVWKDHRRQGTPTAVAAAANRLFVAGHTPTESSSILLVRGYGARSGERLWERLVAPNQVAAAAQAVAADERRVFVAGVGRDDLTHPDGFYVAALLARSGEPLWDDLRPADDARASILSSAVVATGEVVVAAASVNPSSTAPDWGLVRAYRAETGEPLWDREEPNVADVRALAPLEGGVLAVGSTLDVDPLDRRLLVRALDAETGALRFEDAGFEPGTFGACAAASRDLAVVAGASFGTEREILIRAYQLP